MRALILVESLVVLALAVGILRERTATPADAEADVFPVAAFLLDAMPGETIRYRVDASASTLTYRVGSVERGGPKGPPRIEIARTMTDTNGLPVDDVAPSYTHLPHRHGFFPLIAQEVPGAFDRVWVIKRIQRVSYPWQGRPLRCWRVECIDPARPPAQDAVVLWMHEACPVYGIFRWEGGGHTYEAEWKGPP